MSAKDRAHYEQLNKEHIAAQQHLHEQALAEQRKRWAEADAQRKQEIEQQQRLHQEELAQKEAEILYQNDVASLTEDKSAHASDKAEAKQVIDQAQQAVDQMFGKVGSGGGGILTIMSAVAGEIVVGVRRARHEARYPSERRSVREQRRKFHRKRTKAGRKKYTPPPRPDYESSLAQARQRQQAARNNG